MKITPSLLLALFTSAFVSSAVTNLPPSPIVQIWGGGQHTMALLRDGSVWTWGSDYAGKLGDNQFCVSYADTSHDSPIPLKVHGPGNVGYLNSVIATSAGESHNIALRSDGTVWAWGWNGYGQLGDGTTNDAHTPVEVIGLSNVVAISGRGYHCLAMKSDGTLWTWGWDYYGQLGTYLPAGFSSVPIQVVGVTNPVSISAGYSTSLILLTNGTVQMWGTSKYDDMGTVGQSYTPITVTGISNVVSAAANFQEPEVLKSDGTIWMWGGNGYGQLGDGNTNDQMIPGPVLNLTNMIYAGVTGDRDNCAIRGDHTVWTWGRNYNGQLGIGTADYDLHTEPVQVPPFGSADVIIVQTPDWHSLALEADGTMWAWGENPIGANLTVANRVRLG